MNKNVPVYGFNTGVGWNKDKRVFKEFFQEYNRNLIYSHCLGVDSPASEEEVRAIMVARLNTLLTGATGIQPDIAVMYMDLLNAGVHPVIPERGSVGEADIACLSHIGLAMLGEGEVYYKGKRISAADALERAGAGSAELQGPGSYSRRSQGFTFLCGRAFDDTAEFLRRQSVYT